MDNSKITNNLVSIILKATDKDEHKLKSTRKMLVKIVDTVGAKRFVTIAAGILKDNFRIEGCNDVRIPLKRIFTISMEELDDELAKQKYDLPGGHPLVMLSTDHKDNIRKLKALRFSLGGLNLNKETPAVAIKDKFKQTQDYYAELDLHIRKEEEILFTVLEGNGMQEHPQNLREEHKGFREILTKIMEAINSFSPENPDLAIEEIKKSKEKFIADISNHIFRETFIFYPAALGFIKEKGQWKNIKKGFDSIKDNL